MYLTYLYIGSVHQRTHEVLYFGSLLQKPLKRCFFVEISHLGAILLGRRSTLGLSPKICGYLPPPLLLLMGEGERGMHKKSLFHNTWWGLLLVWHVGLRIYLLQNPRILRFFASRQICDVTDTTSQKKSYLMCTTGVFIGTWG